MRLWHDDVRLPPDDSWTWARTNEEAMRLLEAGGVTECSLDHDLGYEEVDPGEPGADLLRGPSPRGTGYDLALWMAETGNVPAVVNIHSWNRPGAERMASVLGYHAWVTMRPYEAPRRG